MGLAMQEIYWRKCLCGRTISLQCGLTAGKERSKEGLRLLFKESSGHSRLLVQPRISQQWACLSIPATLSHGPGAAVGGMASAQMWWGVQSAASGASSNHAPHSGRAEGLPVGQEGCGPVPSLSCHQLRPCPIPERAVPTWVGALGGRQRPHPGLPASLEWGSPRTASRTAQGGSVRRFHVNEGWMASEEIKP